MKIKMNKNKKVKVVKNGKVGVRFIEPAGSVPMIGISLCPPIFI
jgi:hypothetical protein